MNGNTQGMRRIVVLAAVVPLAAACGGHRGVNVKHVLAAHVQRCAAGARLPLGSAKLAYAAVVPRHTVAYREPGRRAIARFRPKRAVITNMHSDLDYEVLRLSLPAGVIPAWDGMRLRVE